MSDYKKQIKVIWSPAITLDGNIATADGNSDWPTDESGKLFHELIRSYGAVIVGHTTYKQYKGSVFPVEGATTFVWTHSSEKGEPNGGVVYVSGEPGEVLAELEKRGFTGCILAGGMATNDAFIQAGMVDEITADIHPLLLGNGMGALTLENFEAKLELLDTRPIGDGVVRNHYIVMKA